MEFETIKTPLGEKKIINAVSSITTPGAIFDMGSNTNDIVVGKKSSGRDKKRIRKRK